ncbi:MAG: hypothetical protein COA57_06425 [Flavobacteriales bacterium]|nr:hypothetical protein [Bacteroidales bacterium AH-315-I05]PCJ86355.1 MAG: hypothetical protein COA57_06425 [Flavobacteriales bacterium]
MEDTFKRLLYAGVGLAAEATEKVQKEIDKLVEKGQVSDLEGKKIVDDFLEKTEDKRKEFESKFNEFVEKHGYSKNSEVAELRKRIDALDAKLAKK